GAGRSPPGPIGLGPDSLAGGACQLLPGRGKKAVRTKEVVSRGGSSDETRTVHDHRRQRQPRPPARPPARGGPGVWDAHGGNFSPVGVAKVEKSYPLAELIARITAPGSPYEARRRKG